MGTLINSQLESICVTRSDYVSVQVTKLSEGQRREHDSHILSCTARRFSDHSDKQNNCEDSADIVKYWPRSVP